MELLTTKYLRQEVRLFQFKFIELNIHEYNLFTDCRRGQSLVVWAITEGRQAARQVDEFLSNTNSWLPGPGGVITTSYKQ